MSLARVTIATPDQRVDLAIPGYIPIAELLPELVAKATSAPGGPGGWSLRASDGMPLSLELTFDQAAVRDGALLHLVSAETDWPAPAYDDPAEAVVSHVDGPLWTTGVARFAALVVAGLAALTGCLIVSFGGLPFAALATALIGLGCGAGLSRVAGDADAGGWVAGLALPYFFLSSFYLMDPGAAVSWHPWSLLVGGVAALLGSALVWVGVGDGDAVPAAGATAGWFAVVSGLLGVAGLPTVGACAVALAALTLAQPVVPLIAIQLAGVRPGTVSADRVVRADQILAGLAAGTSGVVVACAWALAQSGWAGATLMAVTVAVCAIRATAFAALAPRLALLGGAALAGAVTATGVGSGAGTAGRLGLVVVCTLVAAVAVALGLPQAPRSAPYLARLIELAPLVLAILTVPLAVAVCDGYAWVRAWVS